MLHPEIFHVRVELRLEPGTVFRADAMDAEWEAPDDVVDEADGTGFGMLVVDTDQGQCVDPSAKAHASGGAPHWSSARQSRRTDTLD